MKRRGWMVLMVVLIMPFFLTGIGCKKKTSDFSIKDPSAVEKTGAETDADKAAADKAARDKELRGVQAKEEARKQFINEHIYFDFDSSNITIAAQATLRTKAEWLKNNSGAVIVIEGHCDERGTNEYNLALGDRRARAARTFLADLGIQANRMDTVSYGEELPLDNRSNEEAWAKNRRDQFVIK